MSEGPSNKRFRRNVAAVAVAATALVGGVRGVNASRGSQENPRQDPSSLTTPESSGLVTSDTMGDVTVIYDNDIPTGYYITGGAMYNFSPAQIDFMRSVSQSAVRAGEPQLAWTINGTPRPDSETPSSNPHPDMYALPNDVVGEEELRRDGVFEIIQADNTSLYIRREAFEPGGIFYDLVRAQSLNNPPRLRIVLINGGNIGPYYMQDDRYRDVRGLFNVTLPDVTTYRQQQMVYWQGILETARQRLHNTNASQADRDQANIDIMDAFSVIDQYQNSTDEEVGYQMSNQFLGGDIAGMYFQPDESRDNGQQIATIFLSVGAPEPFQQQIRIFFDANGRAVLRGSIRMGSGLFANTPSMAEGFPSPDDWVVNRDSSSQNGDYAFFTRDNEPGDTLRHEFEHMRLITLDPLLNSTAPNPNEHDTDIQAMDTIESASRNYQANGDDSRYVFIFSVPGGGYQFTRRPAFSGTT